MLALNAHVRQMRGRSSELRLRLTATRLGELLAGVRKVQIESRSGLIHRLRLMAGLLPLDADSDESMASLHGHGGSALSVAFGFDETRAASGGMDDTARLWGDEERQHTGSHSRANRRHGWRRRWHNSE